MGENTGFAEFKLQPIGGIAKCFIRSDSTTRLFSIEADASFANECNPVPLQINTRIGSGSMKLWVVAQPAPKNYAERISAALSEMRDIVEEMVGDKFVASNIKRVKYADDDGDECDLRVLSLYILNASTTLRADVIERLLDFLAEYNDPDVQNDLSVEVC